MTNCTGYLEGYAADEYVCWLGEEGRDDVIRRVRDQRAIMRNDGALTRFTAESVRDVVDFREVEGNVDDACIDAIRNTVTAHRGEFQQILDEQDIKYDVLRLPPDAVIDELRHAGLDELSGPDWFALVTKGTSEANRVFLKLRFGIG